MYEICRFLAATSNKAPKARKPRTPSKVAKIGATVEVYGSRATIVGKADRAGWWNIEGPNGKVLAFDRSQFKVI